MPSWSRMRSNSWQASRPACRRGKRQMAEAAEKRDFELAAVYRDRLRA